MTAAFAGRRSRAIPLAAVGAALLAGASSAAAAAAGRAPQCEPGDPAARSDPRCEVGDKPPPGIALGAPSRPAEATAGGAAGAAQERFEAPPPGPLPRGGYLQIGARSDPRAVTTVQRRLARVGFPVPRDGRYGPLTAAAVRRFQLAHRLLVDAVVGRQTSAALRYYSRAPAARRRASEAPPRAGLGSAMQKRTRVVRASASTNGRLTFDARSFNADSIVSGTLRSGKGRWRIAASGLRSAVRRGHVGVRLVRRAGRLTAVVSAARAPRVAIRRSARAAALMRRNRLFIVTRTRRPQDSSSAPSSQPAADQPAASASSREVLFGAFTPNDPYGGHTDDTDALQAATNRNVETVLWFQNWGGGDWISQVQPHLLESVLASGRTPLVTWEPWDATSASADQPIFALRRIASGEFDTYIASWATALRAVGRTIYLRPMHEMNGNWYPWSGTVNGNSPAQYVRAWRRMHNIFTRHGATNVRWVWAPNNVDVPQRVANRFERYYPGREYVDILGVDGYNWGTGVPGWAGWESFSDVFATAHRRLRRLGPQPIWITEVASASQGGDKSAWIRDMFKTAQSMEGLQRIIWFNVDKERDWRATSTPETAAAFTP